MPVLSLACHLPHNAPHIAWRYNYEQTTKQTKAINNSYIYINISCKCDTNRAGHLTLDAYASRPVACLTYDYKMLLLTNPQCIPQGMFRVFYFVLISSLIPIEFQWSISLYSQRLLYWHMDTIALAHWDRDEIDTICRWYFQTHFLEWKCFNFDWDLFLRVQLTIFQHCYR